MDFLFFIFFGLILWGITSFGIDRLDSKIALFSFIKKGIFWLIITPLWMFYILVALAGLINNTDMIDEKFSDKKTVYFSYCSDFKHHIFSCPDDTNISTKKVDFKVSFDRQIVVEDSGTTFKYTKCSVFDANNWNCEWEERTFNVQDGKYSEYDRKHYSPTLDENEKPSILPLFNRIEKSEYFFRKVVEFIRFL